MVKRVKGADLLEVEVLLYDWFIGAQEAKLTLSDGILEEKAKLIYESLSKMDSIMKEYFKFSHNWIQNFKRQHGITWRVLHGNADSIRLTRV